MSDRPPYGWEEMAGVLDQWRTAPLPPGGQGILVLECGPAVAAVLSGADPGSMAVPPPEGPGVSRMIHLHITGAGGGAWRLLEDGEPVASGTLAVGDDEVAR